MKSQVPEETPAASGQADLQYTCVQVPNATCVAGPEDNVVNYGKVAAWEPVLSFTSIMYSEKQRYLMTQCFIDHHSVEDFEKVMIGGTSPG